MAVGGGRWGKAALAALAIVSGAGTAHAYTVKHTGSGATVRWHANAVTLRIDSSMQKYFKDMPVRSMVEQAAGAWGGLPGVPELLISDGDPGPKGFTSKSNASNGVYLVEDWKLSETSLAVTVATFETKSGKIVDTDILVNANHPFALLAAGPDAPADEFDIHGVMTHEMGHVLGLGESFDVRMATMWPNVARGERHQRDLHEDDETGAETAYAEALMSESSSESEGCGGASVLVRRGAGPAPALWIALGMLAIGAGLWLRSRGRQGRGRGLPMLALVLLFGAPVTSEPHGGVDNARVEVLRTLSLRRLPPLERSRGLALAAQSPSTEVRLAAAAVLERSGVREDASIASELSLDHDDEVRRVGRLALERLRSAPPAARIAADSAEAKAQLKALFGESGEVVRGEAVSVGASLANGLIWSKYLVHGESDVLELEIPGGTLGEVTQIVSEQEPPTDGAEVIVAKRASGPHAWALVRDGLVYGGFLGDGPAIEIGL
jgi:hypothetical protein